MIPRDDLIRELALLSHGHDRDVVAEDHDGCAELADAWDATRPIEPNADAWDAIWGKVSARLDQATPEPATVLPMRGRSGRFAAYGFVVAQAAGLLAAATLGFGVSRHDGANSVPATIASAESIDIEAGEIVLIRLEAKGSKTIDLASDDRAGNGIDGYFSMYNDVEALVAVVE